MLRELSETRQVPGDPRRRWFMSPRCDLIVWLRDDETVQGFQFCYDKDEIEHALTWVEGWGYSHMRVDKEGRAQHPGSGTPLLVPDGTFDPDRLLDVFRKECQLVPVDFVTLVSTRLQELAEADANP